jgi:hypothetical protein
MIDDTILLLILFCSLFFSIRLVSEIIVQILLFTNTGNARIHAVYMALPAFFWSTFYYLINK